MLDGRQRCRPAMFGQIGKVSGQNPCELFVGLFKALDHSRNVFENTVRNATTNIHSDVFPGKGWAGSSHAVRGQAATLDGAHGTRRGGGAHGGVDGGVGRALTPALAVRLQP
jgi:hypothetical protein